MATSDFVYFHPINKSCGVVCRGMGGSERQKRCEKPCSLRTSNLLKMKDKRKTFIEPCRGRFYVCSANYSSENELNVGS